MKNPHRFKVGDRVWYIDDIYEIIQLRKDNDHITYRLDNGKIVTESFLY